MCVCVCGLEGGKVRHQLKPLPQSTDMGNEKGGGCYFMFLSLLFCYHPNPAMANYRDREGQTNRLAHRRTHTLTHTSYFLPHRQKRSGKTEQICSLRVSLRRVSTPAGTVKTHCMQIKEAALRVSNRMATTIETAWGARRNTPATTDCSHMSSRG